VCQWCLTRESRFCGYGVKGSITAFQAVGTDSNPVTRSIHKKQGEKNFLKGLINVSDVIIL